MLGLTSLVMVSKRKLCAYYYGLLSVDEVLLGVTLPKVWGIVGGSSPLTTEADDKLNFV